MEFVANNSISKISKMTFNPIRLEKIFNDKNKEVLPSKAVYHVDLTSETEANVRADTYQFCFGQNGQCHPGPDCWGWRPVKSETFKVALSPRGEAYDRKTVTYGKKVGITWGDDTCYEYHNITEERQKILYYVEIEGKGFSAVVEKVTTSVEKTDI